MNTETITKERDETGVYFRRTVRDADGALLSDERVKRDPVLAFEQPSTLTLGSAVTVVVEIPFRLHDYDGELRDDSGAIQFRLQDRSVPDDDGVTFVRQLVDGELSVALDFDAPGQFLLTIEPPFPTDLQLVEPVRVKVV